jgi:hypothetical protein
MGGAEGHDFFVMEASKSRLFGKSSGNTVLITATGSLELALLT